MYIGRNKLISITLFGACLCFFSSLAAADTSQYIQRSHLPPKSAARIEVASDTENCELNFRQVYAWFAQIEDLPKSGITHLRNIQTHFGITPLNRDAVVLDTNILISILKFKEDFQFTFSSADLRVIERVAEKLGVTTRELLSPEFEKKYFWISQQTSLELASGNHPNLTHNLAGNIIPAQLAMPSIDQVAASQLLTNLNLGRRHGEADRKIVMELLFTQTADGSTPRFFTADKGIYNALCKLSPVCKGPEYGGKPVWSRFPEGFEAEVRNYKGEVRKIFVVPISTATDTVITTPSRGRTLH